MSERPPLTITLGEKTYKMTYGLQMDIHRLVPDPTQVISLMTTDPYLRDYIIRRVLTDSPKMIQDDDDLIPAEEVDLSSDEIVEILDWVGGHVLSFFLQSAQAAANLGRKYQDQLGQLMPTSGGSEASPSPTPSAGPSE